MGSQFSCCPKQSRPRATEKYLATVVDLSISDLYIKVSMMADRASSFSSDTNIRPNESAAKAETSIDRELSVLIGTNTSMNSLIDL